MCNNELAMFNFKNLLRDQKLIISPETLKKDIDVHEVGVIVDVRSLQEFLGGHLQDSLNLPLEELTFKIASLVPLKTTRVFCYCQHGNRSYEAAKALQALGYQLAYSLDGGIEAWQKKGLPVVK